MIRRIKILFDKIMLDRLVQHILFWLLSYLILVNILKVSSEIKQIDLIYTAIFHVPIFLIAYINLKILLPLFLEKAKYYQYAFLILVLVSLGSGFYLVLFDKWIDFVFPGYYFIAYYGFWDMSLYLSIYVILSSLIHLARSWFHLQRIEKQKTLSELKALKSQINPHFLFNSLNSIYSLSRKESKEVPGKVIQLSDLMRHIIYDSDVDFISLEKEIEMIKNYIELQNLRTTDNENIKLEVIGATSNKKIAPLIFLPFVENSFKHGLKGGGKNNYVDIKLEVSGKILNFEIENSKGETIPLADTRYKGIGIENVRKRLELIYENQHVLKISNTANYYKVLLQLQLK